MNWHCGVTETELRINRRRSRLDGIAPSSVNALSEVREKGGIYSLQKAFCLLHTTSAEMPLLIAIGTLFANEKERSRQCHIPDMPVQDVFVPLLLDAQYPV